jgi:hypothetical protein
MTMSDSPRKLSLSEYRDLVGETSRPSDEQREGFVHFVATARLTRRRAPVDTVGDTWF